MKLDLVKTDQIPLLLSDIALIYSFFSLSITEYTKYPDANIINVKFPFPCFQSGSQLLKSLGLFTFCEACQELHS